MAIKFYNIRNKQTLVAETEPHISALWASSDHSPNITQGQDFGWRLAPEVVVQMRKIMGDEDMMGKLAQRYNRLPEDVGETEVLQYISEKTSAKDAAVAQDGDYTDTYLSEIARLEGKKDEPEHEDTIEELEAKLAAKRAEMEAKSGDNESAVTPPAAPKPPVRSKVKRKRK